MWCGAKFSNALLGCVAPTVYSNVSIPGYREHNSALPGCDARTVSSVASIPGHQR
jgi:hypothetical protein